jgi:hypothetical protein
MLATTLAALLGLASAAATTSHGGRDLVLGNLIHRRLTTLHATLLVGLLRQLQDLHQALALVRLHRLLDVGHPRTALTTFHCISHFIKRARKIPSVRPLVFRGTHPRYGRRDSTGIPDTSVYPI